MYNPSGGVPFRLLANCFLIFGWDLAMFILPTLLADLCKQNYMYLAHAPSILLLKYKR